MAGRPRLYSDEERLLRKRAAQSRYRQTDKGRKTHTAQSVAQAKKYSWKVNAKNAARHARKLNRCPAWLTVEHLKEIEQFFRDASYLKALTKVRFEVDHIVPLQGKNVSGLHVPWNLQLLTATENREKKNNLKANV